MYSTLNNITNINYQKEHFLFDFERPSRVSARHVQARNHVPQPSRHQSWPTPIPRRVDRSPASHRGSVDWENIEPERQPSKFGPHYWYMLHNMSLNYPMKPSNFAKQKMKAFVEALPFLLPCRDCSEHAKKFMAEAERSGDLKRAMKNRESLFTFLWRFHNSVNERLNKPMVSFHDALAMYSPSL